MNVSWKNASEVKSILLSAGNPMQFGSLKSYFGTCIIKSIIIKSSFMTCIQILVQDLFFLIIIKGDWDAKKFIDILRCYVTVFQVQ